MRLPSLAAPLALLALLALGIARGHAQDAETDVDVEDAMAEAMARMQAMTQPGEHHELLERFLGTWETESRVTMMGADGPGSKGETTFSWLLEGYFLQSRGTGSLMGMPIESFAIFGYDNFKQSFCVTMVDTMDTDMLRAEGDVTRDGNALICYGTLDEYLTGEHDKMVKYVWRFRGDDEFVLEIHDLPIGETGTKVVEQVYRRK